MPLNDWISHALFGDRGRDGDDVDDVFSRPPREGDDEFPGQSMDRELAGMMSMMDQMMNSMFRGGPSMGFRIEFDDEDERRAAHTHHHQVGHGGERPVRNLRHQFLRDVPAAGTTDSSSGRIDGPPAPSDTQSGHDQRRTSNSRGPMTSEGLRDRSALSPSALDFGDTSAVVRGGDSSPPPARGVVHTATRSYSRSTTRRADGSVETKTYDSGPDGNVRTSHSRHLPDQRTLTTYEERSADGTVATREEYSAESAEAPAGDVATFSSEWQQQRQSSSPLAFLFSRPLADKPSDSGRDCPTCAPDDGAEHRDSWLLSARDWLDSWRR